MNSDGHRGVSPPPAQKVAHLEASRRRISGKLALWLDSFQVLAIATTYLLGFSRSHSSILANLPRTLGWLSARAFLQAYCKENVLHVTIPACTHQAKPRSSIELVPWSSCQSFAWSSSSYTWIAFASFLQSSGHWWLQASHQMIEHLLHVQQDEACWLQDSVKIGSVKVPNRLLLHKHLPQFLSTHFLNTESRQHMYWSDGNIPNILHRKVAWKKTNTVQNREAWIS